MVLGDGWSIAWRTHDAQYWGVPQRRKRISLVADFGGRTAPEILFECKSVSRNTKQSEEQGKRTSERVGTSFDGTSEHAYCIQGNCIDRADTAGCNGKGWRTDQCYTLNTIDRPAVCVLDSHPADSRIKISEKDLCQSLTSRMGTGGGNVPMVMEWKEIKTYSTQSYVNSKNKIRRLTPLECERLQGFPDGWTDIGEWVDSKGKKHDSSDSARYKALGNSVALPFWRFLCKRISAQYERTATMASLFDGIGGFPLVWEEFNGKGTAVWASEIEEFPIAVTKYHFKE